MNKLEFYALILAAGRGTRMKSEQAKVLHQAAGRSLLDHTLAAAAGAGAKEALVVLGHGREAVQAALTAQKFLPVREIWQKEQKGTGHAIQIAAESFTKHQDLFLILNGDGPLLRSESLSALLEFHRAQKADLTLGVMEVKNPFGYGRVMASKGKIRKVVEEKEASAQEKKIGLVNGGVYVVSRAFLDRFLPKLKPSKKTGEIYLTDLLSLGTAAKKKLLAFTMPEEELSGVNDQLQLAEASALLRKRLLNGWMKEGICFLDPSRVYVEMNVDIGAGSVIEPGVALFAGTKIGQNVRVEQGCILKKSVVEDGAVIHAYSHLEEALVRRDANVGPFARLRPAADIGEEAKIGNFVEVKKTKLGKNSKVSHLSYLGDAVVGDNVNIGCGFITCNYDGVNKHITKIGDDAFVGSDVQAVAPVEIGAGAYVASGSTITRNVPSGALAIARVKQENKEGYAERLRRRHKNKEKS